MDSDPNSDSENSTGAPIFADTTSVVNEEDSAGGWSTDSESVTDSGIGSGDSDVDSGAGDTESGDNAVICNGLELPCPDAGECAAARCESNVCITVPADFNTPCSGGVCNGIGHCVQCTDAAHCGSITECATPTCIENSCGFSYEISQTTCSAGVCDGNGICVGCTSASNCATSGDCFDATCDNGACGQTPMASGESCLGGYCDGRGNCIECTTDTHCSGDTPVCHNESCTECAPTQPDECASTCTRQYFSCSSTGAWQSAFCSSGAYCSDGACIDDTVTVGWDLGATGTPVSVGNVFAQRIEVNCRSTIVNLGAYFASGENELVKIAFYFHDDATEGPGAKYAEAGGSITTSGPTAVELNVTGSVLEPGAYWLAIIAAGNAEVYSSGSGGGHIQLGTFDLDLTTPWSSIDTFDGTLHVFAILQPAPL